MFKAFFKWVYDWITVIVASSVGLAGPMVGLLNVVGAVNMAPIFGPEVALQIVTYVAIAKGVCAWLVSLKKAAR